MSTERRRANSAGVVHTDYTDSFCHISPGRGVYDGKDCRISRYSIPAAPEKSRFSTSCGLLMCKRTLLLSSRQDRPKQRVIVPCYWVGDSYPSTEIAPTITATMFVAAGVMWPVACWRSTCRRLAYFSRQQQWLLSSNLCEINMA